MVDILGHRIKIGNVLGQLVVQLRQFGLLDALDLDLEHGGLAGQRLCIIFREGDVDLALLAGLGADELFLKAGDESIGADLQIVILGLAAFKRLAVHKSLKVQNDVVSHLHRALHVKQAGVALAHIGQRFLHARFVEFGVIHRHFQPAVLTQLHFRIHGDLEGVDQLFGVIDFDVGNARPADALEAALLRAEGKGLVRVVLDGFFIEDLAAVHALDHLTGGFALPETGNIKLTFISVVGLVDFRVKRRGVNLYLKGCDVMFFLLDILDIHWVDSS